MADRFIQWEIRGIERMRGPLPDCDRCHGFGVVSVPVDDDTATMVLCECADGTQPRRHFLDGPVSDGGV